MRSWSEAAAFEPRREDVSVAAFVPEPLPPRDAVRDADAPAEAPPGADAPDREALRREAFEAGREAGRAELPWREAERLTRAAAALEGAGRALAEVERDYLRAQRHALVELAVAVAERILARELRADPRALRALLEQALDALPPESRQGPLEIRLAPADHELLAQGEGSGLADAGVVRLVADASLAPGDAHIEAGATRLDARRETLLARVREALEPAVDSARDETTGAPA